MARDIQNIAPWPMVSDNLKSHVVSLVIGQYFVNACLIGAMSLEQWISTVARLLEVEIKERVLASGGVWKEYEYFGAEQGPTLAMTIIARWKASPAVRAEFSTLTDYAEYVERAIEQGIPIDNLKS